MPTPDGTVALAPAWRDPVFEDRAHWFGADFAIRSCGTTYADPATHAMWSLFREGKRIGAGDTTEETPGGLQAG